MFTDWVKKAEELKKEMEKAQRKLNFATPVHRKEYAEELGKAKSAYDKALGKALEQKAKERRKKAEAERKAEKKKKK